MKHTRLLLASLLFVTITFTSFAQLTILSGSKQSTQNHYVDDILKVVGPAVDFEIVNKNTLGSAYNLNQLADTSSPFKIGIVQADYLYYMQILDMRLNTEKTKNLKVIIPLGYDQIHLVTKESKGYKDLKEMEKKVVAIGSADQGSYSTANLIKERSGIFWTAKNTHFEDCVHALNNNDIDAFFVVNSAPIPKLDVNPQSMVDKLALVPLVNFNDWAKYYKPDTIHKGEYKWLDHDVPTFSVQELLIVNESKLSPEERDEVLKLRSTVQDKSAELRKSGHPKWDEINFHEWKESDWPLFK